MKFSVSFGAVLALCLSAATAEAAVNTFSRTGPAGARLAAVRYVNSNTALAVGNRGIYRSADHGASWARVQSVPFGHYPLLAINPANSSQAVAVLDGIYVTSDAGATWSKVNNPGVPIEASVRRPQVITWTRDGSAVWIGDNDGDIYRSLDGGTTWTDRGAGSASTISTIEVDAVDPQRIYALSDTTLYITANSGESWSSTPRVHVAWAPSRTDAGVVLATLQSDGTVVESTNHGQSFNPRSASTPGRRLEFAPGQDDTVYGVGETGEVSVTSSGGTSWTERAPVPDRLVFDLGISPTNPAHLLVVTQTGIYGSTDGGATWSARNQGLQERPFVGLHSRVLPDNEGELYVTDYGIERIFRRGTDGQWSALEGSPSPEIGLPFEYPVFAAAPSDGTLYFGQWGEFGRSIDGGVSWTRTSDPTVAPFSMAVDPLDSQVIYLPGVGLPSVKSVDGGASWQPLGTGLPDVVVQLAVNSGTPGRVYALASDFFPRISPLYVSDDSGETWEPSSWNAPSTWTSNVLVHEPGSTDTVYLGLDEGLFKTTNAGADWVQLNPYPQTATPDGIESIAIDPRTPGTLYVTTSHAYPPMRSVDGGENWEPLQASVAGEDVLVDYVIVDPTDSNRIVGLATYGGLMEMTIAPDLAITTGPTQVAGSAGSTTLTVTNNGVYTATRLRLTGTLPAATGGYTVQASAGTTCGITGSALSCEAGLLRPAATLTATVSYTPAAAGQWQASVDADEADSTASNDSVNVTVRAAPANPPPAGGGGGGGGGGRLDYLLLSLLALLLYRTPALRRRFSIVRVSA